MAEDKLETRELSWRQLFPWTEIFRGFEIALDHNKLILAALGILVMAAGWWLLSVGFTANERATPPEFPGNYGASEKGYEDFRRDLVHWNLMHEAAGLAKSDAPPPRYEVKDIAETYDEYRLFKPLDSLNLTGGQQAVDAFLKQLNQMAEKGEPAKDAADALPPLKPEAARKFRARANQYARLGRVKPAGRLMIGPWYEDRGPNPYLLLTGQAGIPWEPGHFWEWFLRDQVPVMIEPLVKFVRPVIYFFSPGADFYSRCYFLAVTLWTLVTWSIFGGAITRIAIVQLARNEPIGMVQAIMYALRRFVSYVTAPLLPVVVVLFLLIVLVVFGWLGWVPYVGPPVVYGIFWPIPLVCGFVMAVLLVGGLIGWPFMVSLVSAQSSDSWEAASRAYQYVYQRAWHIAWYAIVAICYGAVLVFFIGFMGSLTVYLAKWGVSQAPGLSYSGRDPSFLFVWAPTSFGWRELLLEGTQVDGRNVVEERGTRSTSGSQTGGVSRWDRIDPSAYQDFVSSLSWDRKAGAVLVTVWLWVFFLAILGFGYSYFWSAVTIILLLLRRGFDTEDLDEIYLDEEDYEGNYKLGYYKGTGVAAAPAGPTAHGQPAAPARTAPLPMVNAPPTASPAPAAHVPSVPIPVPAPLHVPTPAPVATPAPAPATPAPVASPAPPATPAAPKEATPPDIVVFTPEKKSGDGSS
jgi:hypothetical protein